LIFSWQNRNRGSHITGVLQLPLSISQNPEKTKVLPFLLLVAAMLK
jgi:hypothetical protein